MAVHALLLASMGLNRPTLPAPSAQTPPDIRLDLLPQLTPRGSEPVTAAARQARREALAHLTVPAPAELPAPVPAIPLPAPAASAPADAGPQQNALLGCAPEDLILMTPAEREKCHAQVELARAKRPGSTAETERAARMAGVRALPRIDSVPQDKRAGYEAAQAAQAAVQGDFRQTALAEVLANRHSMGPRGQNIDVNVHAHCSMTLGAGSKGVLRCPHDPPTGVLTEEGRVTPP